MPTVRKKPLPSGQYNSQTPAAEELVWEAAMDGKTNELWLGCPHLLLLRLNSTPQQIISGWLFVPLPSPQSGFFQGVLCLSVLYRLVFLLYHVIHKWPLWTARPGFKSCFPHQSGNPCKSRVSAIFFAQRTGLECNYECNWSWLTKIWHQIFYLFLLFSQFEIIKFLLTEISQDLSALFQNENCRKITPNLWNKPILSVSMPELSSKHLQNSRHICYTVIVAREYERVKSFCLSIRDPIHDLNPLRI